MGGDLNLKKSWHPVLMSNQRRVWEEEKKALDERKRTEQRIKELKEERAKEEIQQKLEAAGSRKRVDRVDWMYQGPSSGQAGTTEEMEGYLLGKRRIDGLIKGTDHKKLEKQASEDSFMALQHANTLRDTAAKIREDPMLAIKKQEQAAYEAMMNDPIKRRQLLASIGGSEEKKAKSKERKHRHHHRHHRHRDDSDGERRRKRRRTGDEERNDEDTQEHYRRRHSDSRRPGSRSISPGRDGYDRNRRQFSRSASPPRRRQDDYDDRNGYSSRTRNQRRRSYSFTSDSRSPSPDRRRESYRPSRGDQARRGNEDSYRSDGQWRDYNDPRHHYPERRDDRLSTERRDLRTPSADNEEERQRKLAAMQQDASALDEDREKRLAALAEQEKAAREAEDMARAKSSKYGDRGDFVNGLHRKAGDMGLADRIGRSRQGLQREG
jgi:hypothetical protein